MLGEAFKRELEARLGGDPYFRLLLDQLSSGHVIQKVSFVREEAAQGPRYRFLLARLGGLTTLDVPAGGDVIERFVWGKHIHLATQEDEVARCGDYLRIRSEVIARWLGEKGFVQVLRRLAFELGASDPPKMLDLPKDSLPAPVPGISQAIYPAYLAMRRDLEEYVVGLVLDLNFALDDALATARQALHLLLKPFGTGPAGL